MNYYLYRITNKVNSKIYVGVHKTQNMDDGYMGSGKVIRTAIMKYGLENFEKEILETFDSAADMFSREAEIVTEEFLARPDVYNLRRGGHGGFDYINANPSESRKASQGRNAKLGGLKVSQSIEGKMRARKNCLIGKGILDENPDLRKSFKGKFHSQETKQLISERTRITSSGNRNSQYGSMWITDGINSKKHRGEIPIGWSRGRI